jgi:hypothetical protein
MRSRLYWCGFPLDVSFFVPDLATRPVVFSSDSVVTGNVFVSKKHFNIFSYVLFDKFSQGPRSYVFRLKQSKLPVHRPTMPPTFIAPLPRNPPAGRRQA